MSYYSIHTPNTSYGNISIGPATTATTGYTYTTGSTSATDLIWGTSGSSCNTTANPVTVTQRAQIELKGDDADILFNGESLKETLREIKEALRIPSKLNRDEQLEKEWEELKSAADHYNKLKQEYKEKQRVWDTLKTQD
jgi:hypothetical protein